MRINTMKNIGCAGLLALIGLAPLMVTPEMLVAAQVHGDKIDLSTTPLTNAQAVTSANPPMTAAGTTNATPPSLVGGATNAPLKFVTLEGKQYGSLSYRQLASFDFKITHEMAARDADPEVATKSVLEQIPADVKVFNGKAVALTGFMVPVDWKDGLVTDSMLVPNRMCCCFGMTPRINELVVVHTTGQGFKAVLDVPMSVLGTFHAGAIRVDGYLIGIYQIDCQHVVDPDKLDPQ